MELKDVIEALLFASQKALSPADLAAVIKTAAEGDEPDPEAQAFKGTKAADIEPVLTQLAGETETLERAYRLVCVGGAWQYVTRPPFAPWLQALVGERPRPARLTPAALETLTIIAYRQPVTRSEMEEIRGVSVDGVMGTLLERGLVEGVGRAETPGRPMRYGTTSLFLESFGLGDLAELPAADELRRIVVETPPEPVTVDPGLATAPPEALAVSDPSDGPDPSDAAPEEPEEPERTDP
ncbi:MAG: SMC-Scp complex subunit ScpB [Verrucomicrobiales bacterium]|nr:SMC-Scp complex subunit ScpB [Verrucomicrobiales bacterium]